MPYFTDDFLQDIKDKCSIEEIIARYVDLKRTGSNLVGLCPFHREKTPSFTVSPDKQIFYCFGCGVGGDVFSFIIKAENVEFPEAVELLCKRLGIAIPEDDKTEADTGKRKKKERIYDIHVAAARFFYKNLMSNEGKKGIEYLKNRGLNMRTIRKFGLGFSPTGWDKLVKYLSSQNFSQTELLESGLVSKGREGKLFDRFRNRLMFPIIDIQGRVIAFGGRVLDDTLPKYLNSPETIIFNKRRNLFALNFVKKNTRGKIILAEGYMDVISLFQAGFNTAVASLGTSLTPEQCRLISRYSKEVIIAYDSDEAGKRASERAIDLLKKEGLYVKVLTMEQGKDPDEYIKTYGAKRFSILLNSAGNYIEYRLSQLRTKYNINDLPQKVKCLSEVVNVLSEINNAVERELYTLKAAKEYDVTPEALQIELMKIRRKKEKKDDKVQKQHAVDSILCPDIKGNKQSERVIRSEEMLLNILYNDNSLYHQIKSRLSEDDFAGELSRRFYSYIMGKIETGDKPDIVFMHKDFSSDEVSYFAKIIEKNYTFEDSNKVLLELIDAIITEGAKLKALKNTEEDMKEMITWYEKMQDKKIKKEQK